MAYKSVADILSYTAQTQPEVTITPGRSGYFSVPSATLDPALFDGDQLRPDVADLIITTYLGFVGQRLSGAREWSRLWLAGSAISYQWAADRGNGDLDVMVGIDPIALRRANPDLEALSDRELSDWLNSWMRTELWPRTAQTTINGKPFEVTYFWNPGVGSAPGDVTAIRPYAAIDLHTRQWVVRPVHVPDDPRRAYPQAWWRAIDGEAATARSIIARYNNARARLAHLAPGSPGAVNASAELRLAAQQAAALYDDIHTGRRAAFGPDGHGYADWHNFRWQAHKLLGTVQALAEIARTARQADEQASISLYGTRIASADEALTGALLWLHARGMT